MPFEVQAPTTLASATRKSDVVNGFPSVALPALNIDWSAGNVFTKTIAANSIFTFSNLSDGETVVVIITAGAGNTVTWPAGIKWPGGAVPIQTNPGTDVYTFVDAGGTIYATVVQAMA